MDQSGRFETDLAVTNTHTYILKNTSNVKLFSQSSGNNKKTYFLNKPEIRLWLSTNIYF